MDNKKIVVITGASSGLGKDFSKALLDENIVVYALARRIDGMKDLKDLGAFPIKMDITKEEDVKNAIDIIIKAHGRIDVLINNAGFGMYGAVEETTIEDARYQYEVNLFGLARITQLVIPYMRDKKDGTIINISSMAGKVYMPLGAWYHSTKHALEGWSDCLRFELEPFNIKVVIVEPGVIKTEFGNVMIDPMLKRSGNGVYSLLANKFAAASRKSYEKGDGSEPKVITDMILHAVKSPRPKIRYVAGKYAKPMIFMRKWFGDWVFDKILQIMMK